MENKRKIESPGKSPVKSTDIKFITSRTLIGDQRRVTRGISFECGLYRFSFKGIKERSLDMKEV